MSPRLLHKRGGEDVPVLVFRRGAEGKKKRLLGIRASWGKGSDIPALLAKKRRERLPSSPILLLVEGGKKSMLVLPRLSRKKRGRRLRAAPWAEKKKRTLEMDDLERGG